MSGQKFDSMEKILKNLQQCKGNPGVFRVFCARRALLCDTLYGIG